MMNVSEYASDVGKSVKDILNLCKKMSININCEEDMLSDDDIIILDNEIASLEDVEEVEALEEETEEFEEELEEIEVEEKPVKKKKPARVEVKKDDFKEKRKEMYKHKEKLMSNKVEDEENVILYKEGMTVAELSSSLGVSPAGIIKKLMTLGTMANINASLDFDTAEIIAADYFKILKKESRYRHL